MKIKCTILLYFLFALNLHAQETINANLYATTQDYLNKSYSYENAKVETKELSDEYIMVKKILDPNTGKKVKNTNRKCWMLEYNGVNYFNLGYASDLPQWNLFVKLDIEGNRLGALIIDKNKQDLLMDIHPGAYGVGLAGVIIKESEKWGSNWKNEKNEKSRILIVDFNLKQPKYGNRNKNCSWGFFLSKKHLIELMQWKKKAKDIKYLRFEQAIEYLNLINENS